MSILATVNRVVLAGFLLSAFLATPLQAIVVTVDFEALATVPKTTPASPFFDPPHVYVIGAPLDVYLGSFGITLKDVTAPGTISGNGVFVDTDINNGSISDDPGNNNYLEQQTGGATSSRSFTLEFAQELDSFAFTRRGFYGLTGSGLIHPQWSAEALDSGGGVLGSVGEGVISTFSSVPSLGFSLNMGGIKAVRFNADHLGFAGRGAPGLDDMVLTFTPVPEPSSLVLLALGGMVLVRKTTKRRS